MSDDLSSGLFQGLCTLLAAYVAWQAVDKYEKQKADLEGKRAFRELFDSFNNRFNELNGHLNQLRASSPGTQLPLGYEDKVQDYLNLCAEEYLWWRKGLIDEDVWLAWLEGIFYYLKAAPIQEHFLKEAQFSKSYYGLFKALDEKEPNWKTPEFSAHS